MERKIFTWHVNYVIVSARKVYVSLVESISLLVVVSQQKRPLPYWHPLSLSQIGHTRRVSDDACEVWYILEEVKKQSLRSEGRWWGTVAICPR